MDHCNWAKSWPNQKIRPTSFSRTVPSSFMTAWMSSTANATASRCKQATSYPPTLRSRRFKLHVYMVTGVRVARGARLHHVDEDYSRFEADMQTGAPEEVVTLGAKATMGRKKLDSERLSKASDFVFAYRLNEVSYRGILSQKPYRGGEAASADAPYVRYEPTVVVDDFEVLHLVDIPFGGDAKKFEVIPIPGYENLECYAPKDEVDDV
ncbi:hypothetical protein J3F83DRAFT_517509 [Trichoderma novae-zelandiae]